MVGSLCRLYDPIFLKQNSYAWHEKNTLFQFKTISEKRTFKVAIFFENTRDPILEKA